MSILDKVKIGNSVQVNLELSKDRLNKETIDAINVSSLAKINDFRITDGKGIGVVLELSNGKEQWFFEDEIDLLDENGNVIKKNNNKKENSIFKIVVFPAPLAPRNPTISPSLISKLISFITFKLIVCLLKKCLIVPFKPGSLEEISNDLDKFLTSIIFFTISFLIF